MPLQQHPVPQHIASYEFKLIGDMTIKQFAYLAGGIIIALIFYASGLPFYFKWPAVIVFGVLGIALAFFPFQERPLSIWLVAFFKAAFRPTLFTWQKQQHRPAFLTYQAKKSTQMEQLRSKQAAPKGQVGLTNYLQSLPHAQISPLEEMENQRLQAINQLFGQTEAQPVLPPTPAVKPPTVPQPLPVPKSTDSVVPQPLPASKPSLSPREVFKPEKKSTAVEAKVNSKLPIPLPPTQPNILTGMVADKRGNLTEGAILEIRNEQGMPIRALKTNQLGQFLIVTPLQNGVYEIETEKDGLSFAIIKIEAKGEIIPPIEIRAKNND